MRLYAVTWGCLGVGKHSLKMRGFPKHVWPRDIWGIQREYRGPYAGFRGLSLWRFISY